MQESLGLAICCTTYSLGGIELNVLRLATWMQARGHRCLIIGAANSPLVDRARVDGIPVLELTARGRYTVVRSARQLARTLQRERIGTLILNVNRDLLLGVLTKRATGNALALVHTQHMQFGHAKTDIIHRWQHRQLDAWISPLPSLAEQTRRLTSVPAERIHQIPFGIDLKPLLNAPSREAARAALQLPQDVFLAGVVGRLDRGKGQEYLIRAAANLRADGVDLHLLLVGEETRGEHQGYGHELHMLVKELHLGDRVHFLGFIQDASVAYAAMDVFTLTSISETYGMVTIEAMAAGCPVIATNGGGTPDLVGGGDTVLLIPPANTNALAEALLRIQQDPALASQLRTSGRAYALRYFSHDAQCDAIEQLVERIRR
ncbi:MAG: glycosyltransferase family 4 protein [Bacteroidetes bacterium]|nr:glycosyltransferase family 4 protein [Bacteroidota bacterium]